MQEEPLIVENHQEISNIEGYFVRTVTKFGNSEKVDCPREYLGRTVYLFSFGLVSPCLCR